MTIWRIIIWTKSGELIDETLFEDFADAMEEADKMVEEKKIAGDPGEYEYDPLIGHTYWWKDGTVLQVSPIWLTKKGEAK